MLKRYISKYKYCAIGAIIAMNCAVVSIFRLEGVIFGLVVLAFCCTLQFFIYNEEHAKSSEPETHTVSEAFFHSIMDTIPEIVYISMFDGSVKYISDRIEKLVGRKPEEIYKTRNSLLQMVHPEDREKVAAQIQKLQDGSEATIEHRLLKKDGAYVWVSNHLNSVRNEWGNITHFNGILISTDERKLYDRNLQSLNARIHQLNDMVNQHAVRDSLTNVYNRRYSLVIMQNEFNRAHTQHKPLSCILMDIDHLDSMNSKYGYFMGNRILLEAVKCIQKHIKSSDVISRYGDDEFLIVLPETGKEELNRKSGLLANELERCLIKDEENNTTMNFRVTIGSSCITAATKSITDMIEQASKSLYAAKREKMQGVKA